MAALLRSVNDRRPASVVRLTREHSVDCFRTFEQRALPVPPIAFQYPQIAYDALPLSEVTDVPREFAQVVMACLA
jgi:hypothetical protein